jgi:photosystem II stability/assembly factor-like uncharacterized protein
MILCFGLMGEAEASVLSGLEARRIGPAAMSGRVTAIDCVREEPDIVYVGGACGGVWKSVNGGLTFQHVFREHAQSIGCLAVDQRNPDTVWVGTGECNVRNSVSIGTGLYRSDDGGEEWTSMGFHDSERISSVVVHPEDSNTVYVAVMGRLWSAGGERGVYKSTDRGTTWKRILFVDENTGCADLEIDPREPEVLYAAMWAFRRSPWFFTSGGPGSGLHRSTDGGETWQVMHDGLPEGILGRIALAVAPSRSGTVYALVEAKETALYRSHEMGERWEKVNDSEPVRFRPFYFSNLVVDPENHRKLYIASFHLVKSNDGGETLSTAISNRVHPDVHAICLHKDRVLIGTDGGVYLSRDEGKTFTFSAGLPLSQFYHVSCDRAHPYNVYGGLQDNGMWYGPSRAMGPGIPAKAWKSVGTNDGMRAIRHPLDPDIVYLEWQGGGLARFDERTGEHKEIQPLPAAACESFRFNWNAPVALDPRNPEVLYMGAQYLFRSENRGDTWERISPDLTTGDPAKLRQEESGGLSPENSTAENHCTLYTISPSPMDEKIIWVGTDDGNVQVTLNRGATWMNVRPHLPGLPDGLCCSHIEAGHAESRVAYAVFDNHRLGDMQPYVYRTEDFGMTWAPLHDENIRGFCHIIREDPVHPDLLFLGTEFGLFASIDRGTEWMRLDQALPPVSVRDLYIHPREHDLVIATHGLGLWIVDDITPLRALTLDLLRQEAAVLPSRTAFLEPPSKFQEFHGDDAFYGENPGGEAMVTYFLEKRHVFGSLELEVLDREGRVVKTLAPTKRKGLNRVCWDLRLEAPKTLKTPGALHRFAYGPMVPEGAYTVRLTKGNEVFTGPLIVEPHRLSRHSKEDRRIRHETVMELYRIQNDLAGRSAQLSRLIAQIDELLGRTPCETVRSQLVDFRKKVDDFHRGIVQHRERSFSRKLAERAAWLYRGVIQFSGRPTDAQLEHLQLIENESRQVRAAYDRLMETVLSEVNPILEAQGLEGLPARG